MDVIALLIARFVTFKLLTNEKSGKNEYFKVQALFPSYICSFVDILCYSFCVCVFFLRLNSNYQIRCCPFFIILMEKKILW